MATLSEARHSKFVSGSSPNSSPQTYFQAFRPWHVLYGVRIRGWKDTANEKNCDNYDERELSLIEKLLPNEMLLAVFHRLPVYSLGILQCVCRQWRAVASSPSLWRAACREAFAHCPSSSNERILRQHYQGSWQKMYLERSHLRFDGIYVARNTYIKTGGADWQVNRKTVHLVAYFRYLRFNSDGTLLYRTTAEPISRVAKSLTKNNRYAKNAFQEGRWKIDGDTVFTAIRYENSTSTEVRSKMKLRSTVRGANNRLDIDYIVSYDREDGRIVPMLPAAHDGDEEGAERRAHSRGLAPYVFVPWDAVNTHVLNLPVEKMDVWIPG